jgi:hypothetical protein
LKNPKSEQPKDQEHQARDTREVAGNGDELLKGELSPTILHDTRITPSTTGSNLSDATLTM